MAVVRKQGTAETDWRRLVLVLLALAAPCRICRVLSTIVFAGLGAGPSMNIGKMVAQQTRIERQEAPVCASVSFERHAANAFQSYVHSALAFSIKVSDWLQNILIMSSHRSAYTASLESRSDLELHTPGSHRVV